MKYFTKHLLASCVIAATTCSSTPAQQPSLQQLQGILPKLNENIQANPGDTKSLCARGYIYRQMGHLPNAVSDFTRAIAADPSMVEAYNYRFVTYMQLKDYAHALKDADQIVRMKPEAVAYCNKGAVLIALKQWDKASKEFAKALQVNKNSAEAYDGMGEGAYKTGKYQLAIGYCTHALQIDPNMTESTYFRGKSYEALGKKALAQKDLEAARGAGYKPGEAFIRTAK